MKKFLSVIIIIFIILTITENVYMSIRCRDINYAVTHYFTTGIFNKYKIYGMENPTISFSNGTAAFIKVEGISSESPHRKIGYTVFLEKNNSGTWKIKKVYPAQVTLQQKSF
ncbi:MULTISPECIES: hypothetical protein [Clostridium]|uniref:DUF4829 domain-containing protein n=1 Tax=Clostridium lapidicellarium TaxID=3240931 RepID=A0ABV4DZV4_9CLOT|nr:hypothetical protein [uncultured Clostridium sp.]NLU07562.1 hypothetical protein [Clostridiales bacterium]